MAPGRNNPCPCGSGKKYKKCCMLKETGGYLSSIAPQKTSACRGSSTSRENQRENRGALPDNEHEVNDSFEKKDPVDEQVGRMGTEIIKLLDKTSAIHAINNLGVEDLRFLNALIVDRMKMLINEKRKSVMSNFIPGNRVRFTSSTGDLKTGTVIKMNQKTVSVAVDGDPGWWNVAPGFLKRIEF